MKEVENKEDNVVEASSKKRKVVLWLLPFAVVVLFIAIRFYQARERETRSVTEFKKSQVHGNGQFRMIPDRALNFRGTMKKGLLGEYYICRFELSDGDFDQFLEDYRTEYKRAEGAGLKFQEINQMTPDYSLDDLPENETFQQYFQREGNMEGFESLYWRPTGTGSISEGAFVNEKKKVVLLFETGTIR